MPKSAAVRHPARQLMLLRSLHTWVGLLIAPTMTFFAITGLLQVYSLHEAHSGYTPPPLIEKLGMLHKNQRFMLGRRRSPGAEPAQRLAAAKSPPEVNRPPAGEAQGPKLATALLKVFFAAVSVGLLFSTATGVWMALKPGPRRRLYAALLVIGALVPVALGSLSG